MIKQFTYGYDPASNRTSETVATTTTTSTPNNVNAITSQSGGVNRTLTYDPNGNITSDGGTRTFEWDAANRLIAVNYTGFTTRSEFTYDGLSRMVRIVEKTGTTINSTRKFVWHGQEKLEFRDAADVVTQRNYRQGQHVGTTAHFYTRDHLGSIREMFTGGGTVVARYDYDPYGRSTTVLGTIPTDFNFTGLYRHSKSNLHLAVYRAYDSDLGRWLNRDPIAEEGGLNLYGYSYNSPTRWKDLLGLACDGEVFMGHNTSSPTGAYNDWKNKRKQSNPTPCFYLTCGGNFYNQKQGFNPGTDGPNVNNYYERGQWWYDPSNSTADIMKAAKAVAKKVCSENQCCQEVAVKVRCDRNWITDAINATVDTSMCGRTLRIKCN